MIKNINFNPVGYNKTNNQKKQAFFGMNHNEAAEIIHMGAELAEQEAWTVLKNRASNVSQEIKDKKTPDIEGLVNAVQNQRTDNINGLKLGKIFECLPVLEGSSHPIRILVDQIENGLNKVLKGHLPERSDSFVEKEAHRKLGSAIAYRMEGVKDSRILTMDFIRLIEDQPSLAEAIAAKKAADEAAYQALKAKSPPKT